MTRNLSRRSPMNARPQPWAVGLAAAGFVGICWLGLLAGCASEAAPVTSATSKYRPAGEGTEAVAAIAPDKTPENNPSTQFSGTTSDPISKVSPPPTTPPVATAAGQIEVPDGDAKTLVAFINRMS